jgi:hypothetical protein
MIDKFGTSLKVGDWIYYHYWNETWGSYAAKIMDICWGGAAVKFKHINNCLIIRDKTNIEKLPKNKAKREQFLFLKKLEQ